MSLFAINFRSLVIAGMFITFFCSFQRSYANTYYSDYGTSRTHNIAIPTGTHSFQVDGIAQYKSTEWYVDGAYTGPDENDYSGFFAIDPEYTRYISGTTQIKAIVYADGWIYEETHIWNLSIAKPDLIVQDISISPSSPIAGQPATITATLKNQGNADAGRFYLRYYIDGQPIGEDDCYFGLNPGESDDESITYTVNDPGNHTVKVFVDCYYDISESNEGNNIREETYNWINPTGNLVVTVKDQNGEIRPNARVVLYTSNWVYLDEKWTGGDGKATWSNIDVGDYKLEAYYNDEYWVNGSATVSHGLTTNVILQRNEPFAYEFAVFNANTNEEVTSGTVPANTPLRYEVRVRNSSPVDRSARVKLWIDRSQTAPYDFYETSSYQSVFKNDGTRTFTFDDTQTPTGTYYRRLEVETYVNANDVKTDSWWWGEAYTVVEYSDADIVQFVPPSGTLTRGNQAQATVRVKNTGTTTRSFWVGLSFAEPNAGEWPEGWYDIHPIQTQTLNPDDEQTLEFDFPLLWWLVPGDYTAVSAVWEGFDSEENLMIHPRFHDVTEPSFHLDSYLLEDVFDRRVFSPLDIESLEQPVESIQELDFITRLGSRNAVGPLVRIEKLGSSEGDTRTLKITIDQAESSKINWFWGRDMSQVILVLPTSAELSNIVLNIDGLNQIQFESYVAFKTATYVSSTLSTSLAELIIGWIAEKVAEAGLLWLTSYTQLPMSYDTYGSDDFVVLAVDFDEEVMGASYDTFEDFTITFDIGFNDGNVGFVGIIADLRYQLNKLSYPRVTFSPLPLLGGGLLQEQEYRILATIYPEAMGFSDVVQDINTPGLPKKFELLQNYPNPFNPQTRIRFSLPRSAFVTIEVYNILGQRVRTLVNEQLSAGHKEVIWDGTDDSGSDVSSGAYFYRIKAGDYTEAKKMILMK